MVNDADTIAPPALEVALASAPAVVRPGLEALFALDRRLGAILRTTREPMVGQLRLTWWHDALIALDRAGAPAEPVLAALTAEVVARGVSGATLAAQVEGWEVLLDGDVPDAAALARFAAGRGGALFAAAARLLGARDAAVERAGEGWALADLAGNLSDPAAVGAARALAAERFGGLFRPRWSRVARPLGVLAILAEGEMAGRGGAALLARVIRHRLTGG